MKQISFCCEGFKLGIENINKKGLSISTQINSQDKLLFFLVFRSCDLIDDEKFSKVLKGFKDSEEIFEFYTQIDRVILFCPWCGKKLSKKYKEVIKGT